MQGSLSVGRLAGIDIRIHYTWLLALFLIAWSLALGYFPTSDHGGGQVIYWILGIVEVILLFISVLLHELGHSLVARLRGIQVENITVFIFGGVSNITRELTTARDEFLISVVGPVISVALAGIFWCIGTVQPSDSALSAVAGYLAYANLLLGLFNIVPGFPLDGGRVLRSIIWGLIGWFLNTGAEASRQEVSIASALAGVPTTTVMDRFPEVVSPTLTVNKFVLDHTVRRGQRALPVVDRGELVGIVSITDAKHYLQSRSRLGAESAAVRPHALSAPVTSGAIGAGR